jgi:P-type Cu+ transporter
MSTITIAIDGMTCGGCRARVERALVATHPLGATVTRNPDGAVVHLVSGQSAEAAIQAIRAAGYHARLVQQPHVGAST